MTDIVREIHLFITIAKIDAALQADRLALQRLPQEIAAIDKSVADLDAAEKKAHEELEAMKLKRRDVEKKLREHEEHLKKSRGQTSMVKTNEEYTALLKEISNLEKAVSDEEETLLILMDGIETAEKDTAAKAAAFQAQREKKLAERKQREADIARVQADSQKLLTEKPKILSEIAPAYQKRYEKLSAHRDLAVTRVENDHCAACRQQIPPQLAVEVRKNDQFIACPACGRILVHYEN
jgi:predicted  nucleic acid-binding Zn-ribbon protein